MAFIIDKQTLDDLQIIGRRREGSVYHLFNRTRTRGGAQILEEMFLYPLADMEKIRRRSDIIRYFRERKIALNFRNDALDTLEHYLSNTDQRTTIAPENDTIQRRLRNYIGADTEYEQLHKGLLAAISVFNGLRELLEKIDVDEAPAAYLRDIIEMQVLLSDPEFSWMHEERDNKKLAYARIVKYDHTLRFVARYKIKKLLYHIYHLDVYISVAKVAEARGFTSPRVLDIKENVLKIEGMYHPQLKDPVANDFQVDYNSNVIFLTGANMAGKSTFMKTLGITLFLAHMGFPVPAVDMEFSVRSGLFTTINLADNLNMGYSHFYAEVLRLKKVAEQVSHTEHLVVIFDELFRGTNVKDAYDATVAVMEAFAGRRNCTFIISTHIMEAGEELRKKCDNINFLYFPTIMEGNIPNYTYRLTPGITNDRHGMMIINNEHILDIIKRRRNSLKSAS